MKKNITTCLILGAALAVGRQANAQNSSPYWSLAGNSNANAVSKLGTTIADPLNLITNNATRIYIATDGKVGVGTTTPQQRFHVEGTSNQAIFVNTSALGATSGSGQIGYAKDLPTAGGQRLGYFLVGSRGGAQSNYNQGGMVGYAEGAWSGTSRPAYLTFETTNSGATARTEKLRITADGYVGIGTSVPNGQLDVNASTYYGIYTSGAGGYGVLSYSNYLGVYGSAPSYGVYGTSNYLGTYGGGDSYGTYGYNGGGGAGAYGYSGNNYGVQGESTDGYGGYFNSTNNWGLFASTSVSGGYAGVFYGKVYAYVYETSDKNLKTDVRDFSNAMSIINRLKPQNYEFKKEAKYASLNLPKGRQYGLIAQDLEQVLPNLVQETTHELRTSKALAPITPGADGKAMPIIPAMQKEAAEKVNIKAVNYTGLIPIMVKAMQEQDAENKQLKDEVLELKNELSELKQAVARLSGNQSTLLLNGAKLGLATPNPVKGSARIQYEVPDGTNRAQLMVTDAVGRTVKMVQLHKSGTVNVDVSTLSSGVYNYSLMADGQTLQTRKMTVAQ